VGYHGYTPHLYVLTRECSRLGVSGRFRALPVVRNRTYFDDYNGEHQTDSQVFTIYGLDEAQIKKWWNNGRGHGKFSTGMRKVIELLKRKVGRLNLSAHPVFYPVRGGSAEIPPNWLIVVKGKGTVSAYSDEQSGQGGAFHSLS
jgi:hypothetical protein